MAGKEMVMLPWEGSWSDYRVQDGMSVPFAGESGGCGPKGASCTSSVPSPLTYEFAA